MYKIISDKKNPVVKRGEWLKLHVKRTIHDSLLDQTYDHAPIYIQADSFPAQYDPREILHLLRKGDSAVVAVFGDTIIKKQGQLPPWWKVKDKLILSFRVLDVFKNDSTKIADETITMDAANKKAKAESDTKKAEVIKEMEAYLNEHKLNYQKTPGGSYVVITDPGNGPLADTGKVAYVKYRGKLFKTDQEFDQNMDGSRQPYPVHVGSGTGVIQGWLEGIPYFHKGGKGFIYVPFFQGYGPQPGPLNVPYANMVFEIEVVDVADSAAQSSPGRPQPSQPRQ